MFVQEPRQVSNLRRFLCESKIDHLLRLCIAQGKGISIVFHSAGKPSLSARKKYDLSNKKGREKMHFLFKHEFIMVRLR